MIGPLAVRTRRVRTLKAPASRMISHVTYGAVGPRRRLLVWGLGALLPGLTTLAAALLSHRLPLVVAAAAATAAAALLASAGVRPAAMLVRRGVGAKFERLAPGVPLVLLLLDSSLLK